MCFFTLVLHSTSPPPPRNVHLYVFSEPSSTAVTNLHPGASLAQSAAQAEGGPRKTPWYRGSTPWNSRFWDRKKNQKMLLLLLLLLLLVCG